MRKPMPRRGGVQTHTEAFNTLLEMRGCQFLYIADTLPISFNTLLEMLG